GTKSSSPDRSAASGLVRRLTRSATVRGRSLSDPDPTGADRVRRTSRTPTYAAAASRTTISPTRITVVMGQLLATPGRLDSAQPHRSPDRGGRRDAGERIGPPWPAAVTVAPGRAKPARGEPVCSPWSRECQARSPP